MHGPNIVGSFILPKKNSIITLSQDQLRLKEMVQNIFGPFLVVIVFLIIVRFFNAKFTIAKVEPALVLGPLLA